MLKKYDDEREFSAFFGWAYILERFLSGDVAGAEQALADARKQNPFAQAYFKGHRRLPKNMPGSYTLGSREEAICCYEIMRQAWEAHPDAMEWLKQE